MGLRKGAHAGSDAGEFDETPTRDKALRSYITVSRVEEADKLNIVQPYAPMLFRQGPQPGPHLLMEFLRGKIAEKDMEQRWKRAEAEHKKLPLDLKSVKWECSLCKEEKAFQEYGVDGGILRFRTHIVERVLSPVAWHSCSSCNLALKSGGMRAALIPCQGCEERLPEDKFDSDRLANWRKNCNLSRQAICLRCWPTMQRNRRDTTVTLRCAACSKTLALKAFDAARVREWRRSDSLAFATCLGCEPAKPEDGLYKCNKCNCDLPLHAFGAHMQKRRGPNRWRCDACQRPACTVCDTRPEQPLSHSVEPLHNRCQTCLYPPCSRLRLGAPRPRARSASRRRASHRGGQSSSSAGGWMGGSVR